MVRDFILVRSILLLNNELFCILLLVYRSLSVGVGVAGFKLLDGGFGLRVGNDICSVGSLLFTFPSANIQLTLCNTTTLKKTTNWFSRPIIA